MIVPFIQFMRPNGRAVPESIELPVEPSKVQEIIDSGCRLTCEVLMNGMCSFCIEHPSHGDFDQEVCANGPNVPIRIKAMIERFDAQAFREWIQIQES